MKKLFLLLILISLLGSGCDSTPTYQPVAVETPQPKISPVAPVSPPTLSPSPKQIPEPKTETRSNCDPNYSGCVPIASDVDCAGGSGNGPAYVRGPINVIGSDIYGLDRNGDGVACE